MLADLEKAGEELVRSVQAQAPDAALAALPQQGQHGKKKKHGELCVVLHEFLSSVWGGEGPACVFVVGEK